jgi:hypothetical protein
VDLWYAAWTAQGAEDWAALGRLADSVVETLELSAADRLERLNVLDRMRGAIEAEQLRLLAGFYDSQVAGDLDRQVEPRDVGRTAALELSTSRRIASQTAAAQIALAVNTVHDHPMTLDALENGQLSLAAVRAVVGEGEVLAAVDRARLDQLCVHDVVTRDLTPGQTRLAARRRVLQLDPAAAHERCAVARERRDVRYLALADGVADLVVRTEAEQALRCLRSLDRSARRAHAAGDPRSLSQLRADTLVEHVLGDPDTSPQPVELQVVVTADALLGDDGGPVPEGGEPALLLGYGPLPTPIADRLADTDPRWLGQLLADPLDYHVTATSPRTRAFRGEVRAFLQARDQTCAVATCERPGEEADHVLRYADGGVTVGGDGRWLCAAHNRAKEHPDVTVTAGPHHTTTWRMPSGNEYTNHPPPALGHGSGDLPWGLLFEDDVGRSGTG